MPSPPPSSGESIAERERQVAALTTAGHSAAEIAVRMGISARSVVRIRSRIGISKPRHPHPTSNQLAIARRLLDEGASYAEAARTVGCRPCTLSRHFPGKGWTAQDALEWARFRNQMRITERLVA